MIDWFSSRVSTAASVAGLARRRCSQGSLLRFGSVSQ